MPGLGDYEKKPEGERGFRMPRQDSPFDFGLSNEPTKVDVPEKFSDVPKPEGGELGKTAKGIGGSIASTAVSAIIGSMNQPPPAMTTDPSGGISNVKFG